MTKHSHKSKSESNLIELGSQVVGDTSWDYLDHCDTLECDLMVTKKMVEVSLRTTVSTSRLCTREARYTSRSSRRT